MTPKQSYTLQEAADILQTTPRTLRYWHKTNEIELTNVSRDPNSSKPRFIVMADALDRCIRKRTTGTQPKPKSVVKKTKPADYIEFIK